MEQARYPLVMVNGVPVVTAPAEIDISDANRLRETLLAAASRGHGTFVVDMTRTQFCDSAGISVLVGAHKRALAECGELRLVIPASAAALRMFALTGIDQVIPHFPTLYEAVQPGHAAGAQSGRGRTRLRAPDGGSAAIDAAVSGVCVISWRRHRTPIQARRPPRAFMVNRCGPPS